MSGMRLFAAWLVVAGALVGFTGLGSYNAGVLVHHGHQPAEVLYGWPAVSYLCPRIAAGLVAVTLVGGIVAMIMEVGRRG
jgi:hypothetical protein